MSTGVTAKHPLTRVQFTAHDVPGGGCDFNKDQMIRDQLHKQVVLGQVDNEDSLGRNSPELKSNVTLKTTVQRSNNFK